MSQKPPKSQRLLVAGNSPVCRTLRYILGAQSISEFLGLTADQFNSRENTVLLLLAGDNEAMLERAQCYRRGYCLKQICVGESEAQSLDRLLLKIARGPQRDEIVARELFSNKLYTIAHDLKPLWLKHQKTGSIFRARTRRTDYNVKDLATRCLDKVEGTLRFLEGTAGTSLEAILFERTMAPLFSDIREWFTRCDDSCHAKLMSEEFSRWLAESQRDKALSQFKYIFDQQGKIQINELIEHLNPSQNYSS